MKINIPLILIFTLVCSSLSTRIRQQERDNLSINIDLPPGSNVTSTFPIDPGMNFTSPREPVTPSPDAGEEFRHGASPRDVFNPSRPHRPSDNRTRLNRVRLPSDESVRVGASRNMTHLLNMPPIIPRGFWLEKYRIIPPQFWDLNMTDAIVLNMRNNRALSCDVDGSIKFRKLNIENYGQYWFPEFLAENIIRLRSYWGGYLYYNSEMNMVSCDLREKHFQTRWDVFLTGEGQNKCLLLMSFMKFLGYDNKYALLNNWQGDFNKFCFTGNNTVLSSWRNEERYAFSFNPSIFQTEMKTNTTS